jgi:hypothetical protein
MPKTQRDVTHVSYVLDLINKAAISAAAAMMQLRTVTPLKFASGIGLPFFFLF